MLTCNRTGWLLRIGAVALVGLLVVVLPTAGQHRHARNTPQRSAGRDPVDLFGGMAAGQLDVQVVAHGANRCSVQIRNKTRSPLNISLPEVFCCVPRPGGDKIVGPSSQAIGSGFPYHLAGMTGRRNPAINNRPDAPNNPARPMVAGQPVANPSSYVRYGPYRTVPRPDPRHYVRYGANRYVPRTDLRNGSTGNIYFNLPAPKIQQNARNRRNIRQPPSGPKPDEPDGPSLKLHPGRSSRLELKAVCLERHKASPNASISYEIKPIAGFTEEVEVHEICRMLARGKISQRSAQLAAWHFTDDLSWEALGARRLPDGSFPPKFAEAMRAVAMAAERARGGTLADPGKHDSMSREP